MAVQDKLVTNAGLRAAYDDLNGKYTEVKADLGALSTPVTLAEWEAGGLDTTNGADYADANYIRSLGKVGKTLGHAKLTCDAGYKMLLYAWTTAGVYAGALKTDGTINKTVSGWKSVTELNLGAYPGYCFRISLKRDPASSDITTAEGAEHVSVLMATVYNLDGKVEALKADLENLDDILNDGYYASDNLISSGTRSDYSIKNDGSQEKASKWYLYTYNANAVDMFTMVKLWNADSYNQAAIAFYSSSTPSVESLVDIIQFQSYGLNTFENVRVPANAVIACLCSRHLSGAAEIYGGKYVTHSIIDDVSELNLAVSTLSDKVKDKGRKFDHVGYLSTQSPYIGPASVSSITVIDGLLFVFGYAQNDNASTGRIYQIKDDGTLKDTGATFTSDIGHQNTLDFCNESKCLIASRYNTDKCIYIFQNVENTIRSFSVANALKIDLTNESNIGDGAINVIWAYNNRSRYDMAFVMSFDGAKTTRYVTLMQLGKGSNNLGSGNIVSGAGDDEFNGTYQIVKTVSNSLQTIGGVIDRCNDACYFDGKIYEIPAPSKVSGLALMEHSIEDFGTTLATKKIFIEERYATGLQIGSGNLGVEHEGIAIYNGFLYTGRHSGGLEIYKF